MILNCNNKVIPPNIYLMLKTWPFISNPLNAVTDFNNSSKMSAFDMLQLLKPPSATQRFWLFPPWSYHSVYSSPSQLLGFMEIIILFLDENVATSFSITTDLLHLSYNQLSNSCLICLFWLNLQNSVIHRFISIGCTNHYCLSLRAGSIVKVDGSEVSRFTLHMYKITENPILKVYLYYVFESLT